MPAVTYLPSRTMSQRVEADVGRIASISGLWKKLVRQFGSYDNFLKEVAENNHKVLWVEPTRCSRGLRCRSGLSDPRRQIASLGS